MATISPFRPVPILDTFTRSTNVGTDFERWGTTDSGAAWRSTKTTNFTVLKDLSDVTNPIGEGKIAIAHGLNYGTAWISLDSAGVALQNLSMEQLAVMKWSSESSSNPVTDFGLVCNRENSSNFYYCSLQGSIGEVSIGAYVGGQRYELATRSKTLKDNTWYYIRFQRDSDKLYLKVWERGTVEPNSWTLSSDLYDAGNPPATGGGGIFYKGTQDNYTVHVESYMFYTKEADIDAEPGKPVIDTFTREVNGGFGKADTKHTWEGHFSQDPRVNTHIGFVDGTTGVLRITNTGNYYGFIGPSTTSAIETCVEFEMNTANTTNYFYVYAGLHGTYSQNDGVAQAVGYAARIQSGSNKLGIYKKTSATSGWTLINETTLPAALLANTIYKLKFQKTGSTLRANCWTGVEPSTWNNTTTDSSITAGGQAFLHVTQDATATRTLKVHSFSYGALTQLPGETVLTTPTIIGAQPAPIISDTSLNYGMSYTNDSNSNNTLVIKYRKTSETSWTTATTPARSTVSGGGSYTGSITGLAPGTTYEFSFEFDDPEGVFVSGVGKNPYTYQLTTLFNRSVIGKLTLEDVATSTANFKLTYSGDIPSSDATATIQKRTFGSWSTFFEHDFRGDVDEDLHGLVGTISSDTFTKHTTASTLPSGNIKTRLGRAYLSAPATSLIGGNEVVYLGNFTGQSQMTISTKVYIHDYKHVRAGIVFRANPAAHTYYVAYLAPVYTNGTSRVILAKRTAGAYTEIARSDEINIDKDVFYDLTVRMADVSGDNLKIVYFNGEDVIRSTDNTITSPHQAGIFFQAQTADMAYSYGKGMSLYGFEVDGRLSAGGWDGAVAMTAAAAGTGPYPTETHRYFYYNATGLSPDTFYEFKATLADPQGVVGTTSTTKVLLTHGNKAYFEETSVISAITYPTSAVIYVDYEGDSNANSSITLQYKLTDETIWTTVPTSFVSVDRPSKKFRTILSGIRPSSTYDIRATLADPDGIEDHQEYVAEAVITTQSVQREFDKPLKSYQWKIYDNATGRYVETWHDAGAPKFTFEENSGVSDLTVRLPRAVSTLNDPNTSISHQNIVDVWVIDTYELGLGPNLIEDEDFTIGKWTFTQIPDIAEYHATQGVAGDRCIKITESGSTIHEVYSEPIFIDPVKGVKNNAPDLYKNREDFRRRTFILSAYAKAVEGRAVLGVYEYGYDGEGGENQLLFGDDVAETVGSDWQRLSLSYRIKHPDTQYIRMVLRNDGAGTYWYDKGAIRAKEQLIYSGHIEGISSVIEQNQEYIDIEVYGEASVLSDDVIEFLQFVERPQARDRIYDTNGNPLLDNDGIEVEKVNYGATDPSNMLKYAIDIAQQQNPKCRLYYTEDSIRNTGIPDAQYTFREQQLRAVFDKIRDLSPSGWHYVIMPDGLVVFRGPEHVKTHILRVGVEVVYYKQNFVIKDLKNVIHFKGRQDSDFSEGDGYGSIIAVESDPQSIDKYGRRVLYVQDASVVDPETANTFAEGRLAEMNRPENQINCRVIDEKVVYENYLGFRGYNIESFIPGDYIYLINPSADTQKTYWDQAIWDQDLWDYSTAESLVTESVPIKTLTYDDYIVELNLSQRPPSFTSDFQRLARKSLQNDGEK